MSILAIILRVLVGLPFLVFGLNHFVPFMKMEPPPLPEAAMQMMGAMVPTHYMDVVKALEVVGGLMLLVGRFVPLGLVLLVPVTVNIAIWDALIMKYAGPPIGTILLVFEIVLLWLYRSYFLPLFTIKAKVGA
jgi:hypothetical protein